jgi:hypothetical protein
MVWTISSVDATKLFGLPIDHLVCDASHVFGGDLDCPPSYREFEGLIRGGVAISCLLPFLNHVETDRVFSDSGRRSPVGSQWAFTSNR